MVDDEQAGGTRGNIGNVTTWSRAQDTLPGRGVAAARLAS